MPTQQAQSRASLEKIAQIFRAFAEPTRLAILQELKSGEKSVNTLVESLSLSQGNVSKQLKILHDANLLQRTKVRNTVNYRLGGKFVLEMCRLACEKLNQDKLDTKELVFHI
jgi:DNA-binding transcriptional ArsR family regulator